MAYELIITEKPQAAKKIAEALADGKTEKKSEGTVPYYLIQHNKKDIVIGCAVGHLYTVAEKGKGKWTYPIFDLEWVPSYEKSKEDYSKKYLNVLKKLAKDATSYTVACDYDIEGEVIGLNIVKYACKQKDANRMKFSTLIKPDLVKSYETKQKHLDWGQANAGETRHFLDWMYGINLSRALTLAIKAAGRFKVLSSGRVQGPALKIIVDKELEIRGFKPEKYWQLQLLGRIKECDVEAYHKEDRFWDEKKCFEILEKTKGKDGFVSDVQKSETVQNAPHPFDLTSLQTEAYRSMGISPKDTLATAQNLYIGGYISYPRTSSQELPKEINFKAILDSLKSKPEYKPLCETLLKGKLEPNNGLKKDPAHPAIYPTGIIPKTLHSREAAVYDLIVRRFMSTFGENAVRETSTIYIDVNSEIFIARGTRTVKEGWFMYYGRHVKLKDVEFPEINKNDFVKVKEINKLDKETSPPKRYTEASIIKELEKRNLGTKATRAQIIDNLQQRGYVGGKSLEATNLGIKTVQTLERYCPEILDEELTRHFEIEMDEIREDRKKGKEVLDEAQLELTKILHHFKQNEKLIGEHLLESHNETLESENNLGKCPDCDGSLKVTYSKKTRKRFVACSNYPNCTRTFNVPQAGKIKPLGKQCEACGLPLFEMIKGKRVQKVCLNPDCPTKKILDPVLAAEVEGMKNGTIEKQCPKCKVGKLVLRTSVYGRFYGCGTFPKCRYIQKIGATPSSYKKKTETKESSEEIKKTVKKVAKPKENKKETKPKAVKAVKKESKNKSK
jgi:DNA topoisomerase I